MTNLKMQSEFQDFKTVNEPTLRVVVDLTSSQMVGALADVLRNEMVRVAGQAGEVLLQDLSSEGIRKYLSTLSWMRCVRSRGVSNQLSNAYRHLTRSVAVPVLWYQVLICIGRAYDKTYSIEFLPGTSISESDLLTPEEMLAISDIMFSLQNNGLKLAAGIPQGVEGELDFMAMAHVGETVLSYHKTHAVYGFLASFFATEETSKALGALVRIRYGYDSDYRAILARIVASTGGEG